MNIDLYIEILCGLFSLAFGIWLFEYILRGGRKSKMPVVKSQNKFYLLSMIFMLVGVGLIIAAVISFTSTDEVYK